jgi:two-component system, OmpR family, sensor histidine kinase VanS
MNTPGGAETVTINVSSQSEQGRGIKIGLRSKFILLVGGLLLAFFTAITIFLVTNFRSQVNDRTRANIQASTQISTRSIGNTFTTSTSTNVRTATDGTVNTILELDRNISDVEIYEVTGNKVYARQDQTAVRVSPYDLISKNFGVIRKSGQIVAVVDPYVEEGNIHRYSIVYTVDQQTLQGALLSITLQVIGFTALVYLLILTLLYIVLNHWLISRIRSLSVQAQSIHDGKDFNQIEVQGNDEISQLADTLNAMAKSLKANIDKLEELDKTKTEFMMVTSHNLRTPLTIINGYLDSVTGSETAEELLDVIKQTAKSARRLNGFAEDMLTISRFELGQAPTNLESVNMMDVMKNVGEDFQAVAGEKNITFDVILPKATTVQAKINKPHIRAALWNLLDNAYKFTPDNGRIVLGLEELSPEEIRIAVGDSGYGIPEAEIPMLFTKFHRGAASAIHNVQGSGIGLYLTKLIIDEHKGRIEVTSNPGKGSTISFVLPRG